MRIQIDINYEVQETNSISAILETLTNELEERGAKVNRFVSSDNKPKVKTTPYIRNKVCTFLKIPEEALNKPTRKREIVEARQISMFFSKIMTKDSLASIGSQIGDKDHATVLHACKTINNLIDSDKQFRNKILTIEKQL